MHHKKQLSCNRHKVVEDTDFNAVKSICNHLFGEGNDFLDKQGITATSEKWQTHSAVIRDVLEMIYCYPSKEERLRCLKGS